MKGKLLFHALIFSVTFSFAQTIPAYVPTANLVAWYSFNGNTNDLSGNGHHLVNHGATLTSDRCGNANSAYAFNGDSGYLASIDTFFNNGWSNFSISLWFLTDTTSNPYNGNHSQTMFNTVPHYGTELSMSWGGITSKADFFYTSTPSDYNPWDIFSNNAALSADTIRTRTWTHLALVKSDTTYKMYLNGVLNNTFHNPTAAISYLCQIYIGNISGPYNPETFWGSLDDYGIWNRSLSAAEVWQLYNNSCSGVPSCIPLGGLVAWYPFTGNTVDETGNGHDLVNHGATLTTDRCGNANSAYAFNGDTGYLASIDTFFNNGWSNFSISLWFLTDTTSNPYNGNHSQTMFNTVPHYGTELSMSWGGITSKADFFYTSTPSDYNPWDIFSNNAALSVDTVFSRTWYHLALVKSDTTYLMYLNGVLNNTFHNPTAAISYLCQIYVGNISGPYNPETFWGSLDDYGIWNRALSSAEVWQVYNACCSPSAINELPASGQISVYPVPASGLLFVKSNAQLSGTAYAILDLTGRVVGEGHLTGASTEIDITGLAPSVYVLKVANSDIPAIKFVRN